MSDQLGLWDAVSRALPVKDHHGLTVDDARQKLEAQLVDGATCPCCDRFARRYRRGLTAGMAVVLCRIVRRSVGKGTPWVNVTELKDPPRGGDYAKARHWGLIEQAPPDPDDPTRRSSGVWRATNKGVDFALGRITVPRAYIEYDSTVLGFEQEHVSIQQALGNRFCYATLMSGGA
jgi:hypothetical protein